MKKLKYLALAVSFAAAFPFLGCDSDPIELSEPVTAEVTGKTAYLVKLNCGNTIAYDPLYVESITGLTASRAVVENPVIMEKGLSAKEFKENANKAYLSMKDKFPAHHKNAKNLEKYEKAFAKLRSQKNAARNIGEYNETAEHESKLSEGDKREFYINIYELDEGDDDVLAYDECPATLRASGKYCDVWVVDDYFTTSSNPTVMKVDESQARDIQEKFDIIYPYITAVYGCESDEIYYYDDEGKESIQNLSTFNHGLELGSKINIVIYAMGNNRPGLAGEFIPKDYYYSETSKENLIDCSNGGKFLYINSEFINTDKEDVYLTLAHEFQHMVYFNRKTLSIDGDSNLTFYNEMFSMLCEDMMREKLGLPKDVSPINRLPLFNFTYNASGIGEFIEDDDLGNDSSYSQSYAFGAWLARQYGGAGFVKKCMENRENNIYCILKELKMKDEEVLFEKYIRSIINDGLNKKADESFKSKDGYSYPMCAIDLWNLKEEIPEFYKEDNDNVRYEGLMCLDSGKDGNVELRPKGYSIHEIGTVNEGVSSITVELSGSEAGFVKYFLVFK